MVSKVISKENKIGSWAFLIGMVLAVLVGLMGTQNRTLIYLLFFIGLVVGFLNVAVHEVQPFLMAGAVLVIVSAFGNNSIQVPYISPILEAITILFVPATLIVALKHVFGMARH